MTPLSEEIPPHTPDRRAGARIPSPTSRDTWPDHRAGARISSPTSRDTWPDPRSGARIPNPTNLEAYSNLWPTMPSPAGGFIPYMQRTITRLRELGREQTADNYASTLHSFSRFTGGRDVPWTRFNAVIVMDYEAWLKASGISMNTISFYNRILRAVYNRAVEAGIAAPTNPFRHVYTGVDRTDKRAIPLKYIRRIKDLDLSANPDRDFARDMFLFSFYTRGMSFVDMAYLRRSDLRGGTLVYCRRKTGQRMSVRWEPCMQEIVDKYAGRNADEVHGAKSVAMKIRNAEAQSKTEASTSAGPAAASGGQGSQPCAESEFLLPIIDGNRDERGRRTQYKSAIRLVNRHLKAIAKQIGLSVNLTTYVSRHSWASAARKRNIPLPVISEGLGHDSELTTRIYLASLDNAVIDDANRSILRLL